MFLLPLDVHDDADRASEGLAEHIKRNLVVNGLVGAEYVVRGMFPVRAGFFTDFAASPFPPCGQGLRNNPNTANYEHVNRYGGQSLDRLPDGTHRHRRWHDHLYGSGDN